MDLVNTLQELNALDVGFVSLSEAISLMTPSGRVLAVTEFELRGVSDAAGAGIGDRDAESRGSGTIGSEATEEGIQPGLETSAGSRCSPR